MGDMYVAIPELFSSLVEACIDGGTLRVSNGPMHDWNSIWSVGFMASVVNQSKV